MCRYYSEVDDFDGVCVYTHTHTHIHIYIIGYCFPISNIHSCELSGWQNLITMLKLCNRIKIKSIAKKMCLLNIQHIID